MVVSLVAAEFIEQCTKKDLLFSKLCKQKMKRTQKPENTWTHIHLPSYHTTICLNNTEELTQKAMILKGLLSAWGVIGNNFQPKQNIPAGGDKSGRKVFTMEGTFLWVWHDTFFLKWFDWGDDFHLLA